MKKIFSMCFLVLFASLSFLSAKKTANAITGSGTTEDPYLIYTADDLRVVGTDLTGHFKQMNDIDLEHELVPVIASTTSPGFQGTYDGQNYKIINLKIESDSHYIGLFGRCKNAEIKNIKMINPEIEYTSTSSGPIIGGIAGTANDSIISNCSVTGNGYIKNLTIGGGIVGELTNSTVSNCFVTIPVMNNSTAGGIAGNCKGTSTIENCYATNDVTSRNITNTKVGGIVGAFPGNNLTISQCYSTGKLVSYSIAGGILGTGSTGTLKVENCFSISDIKINQIGTNTSKAGGLIGQMTAPKLINCYFAGTLDSAKNYGLTERATSSGVTTNCYFDGQKNNNVENYSYSKITSSMLKQVTYTNWDFDEIWSIDQDSSYPYLKDLPKPESVIVTPLDVPVDSITVTPSSKIMELYDVLDLSYEILPQNATDTSVTFTTSDSSVAVINKNNQVVAIGNGSATITVTTSNGKCAVCNVTVGTGEKNIAVEEVSISPTLKVMNVNDTLQLSADITPTNATNKMIQWTSTNTDVLTVSQEGIVTAKNVGFGSIVALAESGHHLAFCNILVKGTSSNLALNADASASSYYYFKNNNPPTTYVASKGNDGNSDTYWKLSNYNDGDMYYTLTFPKKVLFNKINIKENGTQINEYKLQIWNENQWVDIESGTGIGSNYSKKLETYCTKKIRLLITSRVSNESEELPAISEFEAYHELP